MPTAPDHAKTIFLDALEIPTAAARQEYLDRMCGSDASLRAEVEELLRHHAQIPAAGDACAAVRTVEMPVEAPVAGKSGTVIGPYKLLQQIGEGGMGTVYMAEQTEPVQRKVALKLIKPGMDSRQVISRFEAERQALALMDHPHIAKVLDAGTTGSGLPYFVMELVKGLPITKYCDEHHLTPRERLELFIPVCQAVQHAHQKGIIHRDLKPSNVLVALYDGRPVPKVIDFGVAKATGQKLTERTMYTEFGAIVGTLEYMSPEQAESNQLDIDTRSDIYSLGVLLYELLTGTTPFEKKRLKDAALMEVLRIIREDEPQKPSTRLSSTDELPSISANRGLEPKKLSALVRGELDWIVMKALEKDRNRRYETANGFALDIQRYLADEPVLACPPSARYRLRKFARRNKGGLAVGALVLFFFVLMGSGVGWVWRDRSARAAEAARKQMEQEVEAARQQGERQAKVAGEVESIFAEVDRLEKEQKWSEALDAARRAEAAVAGGEAHPATAERVHQRLRDLEFIDRLEHVRMLCWAWVEGSFDNAGADREYAGAFREYGVDVDELPVETSIDRLMARPAFTVVLGAALDDWVFARRFASRADDARWQRQVAVARGIDPEPLRDRVRAAWGQPVADVRDDLRRLAESIDVRAQHPATLNILAHSLLRVQHADSALRILRDAQYVHPGDFWLNSKLGLVLQLQKDQEGATRFLTAAVAIRPSSTIAHFNLGTALQWQKKLDEAIAEYRKAIELDPKLAFAHNNLGSVRSRQIKLDEAIACYRTAIELDPKYAPAYNNLGIAFRNQNKLDEAIAAHHKAIELDPKYAVAYNGLGNALRAQEKLDEAIACYRTAIELDPEFTPADVDLGNALAVDCAAQGRPADSLWLIGELLAKADRPGRNLLTDSVTVSSCIQHFRRLGDVSSCRAAAAALEKKNPADVGSLYNTACCRALTAAAQAQAGGLDAARLVKEEADRAMALLTKAIDAGFSDASLMRQDADLDSLRGREDFPKLLAHVESKVPPVDLARSYIRGSQWDMAAAAYANVDLWARPLREDVVFARASLYLIQGDSEGYNRFCQDMLRRVTQTEDHFEAFVLVRTCTMGRQSPVDPAQAVQWAKQAVAGDQLPWYFHALGLAQYRAGQFDEALQSFSRANVEAWPSRDLNWFGLALVHHHLDHPDEAQQCLGKGVQWLERHGPPGPGQPANIHPMDWLEAHVLRREAEDVLKIEQSP